MIIWSGWTQRTFLIASLLTLAAASATCSGGAPADGEAGAQRLELYVAGQGSPTVVLEAGLGDSSQPWSAVADRLALVTRVVRYDRAGLGRSAAGAGPRTAARIAEELHAALRRAAIEPPYVLVSHSAGAWYALLFASRHPAEVVGMVLVDPTPFDFFAQVPALQSAEERGELERQERAYVAAASAGRRAEWQARDQAALEAKGAAVPPVPLIVVTADAPQPGRSEKIREYWRAEHRRLASLSPRGRQLLVGAGHYVQLERPDVVVGAVESVLHVP